MYTQTYLTILILFLNPQKTMCPHFPFMELHSDICYVKMRIGLTKNTLTYPQIRKIHIHLGFLVQKDRMPYYVYFKNRLLETNLWLYFIQKMGTLLMKNADD